MRGAFVSLVSPSSYRKGVDSSPGLLVGCVACGVVVVGCVFCLFCLLLHHQGDLLPVFTISSS